MYEQYYEEIGAQMPTISSPKPQWKIDLNDGMCTPISANNGTSESIELILVHKTTEYCQHLRRTR